jgi:aspartyl-tRNA(Asn)/glutamyl-tRNA(Gln) amidotransferase subunit A
MTELAFLGLREAARSIRDGALSPTDYVGALIGRIERHDGVLSSFLSVLGEQALDGARRAEEALAKGRPLGPMHGVPFGLKDIIDVAGLPMTAHSRLLENNIAEADATVAARLKAAGGILLGKLATHEFAIGGPSFDLPWPPARNPWDPSRMPGGSSSGAGAAVAAGFLPGAIGTDTGGSVRNPATACGIVGLKPTYGLVSRRGVFPLSYSLDHVGPLTRTVADNAALLGAIAGHDPGDPGSAAQRPEDYCREIGRDIAGFRIGHIGHFYRSDMTAEPEMAAGIAAAMAQLSALGAEIEDVTVRPLDELNAINRTILLSEAYAIHRPWITTRPDDYGALTLQRLLPGAFLSGPDYVDAQRARAAFAAEFNGLFDRFDAIVTASSMHVPFVIDDAEAGAREYPRQARAPFNLSGGPVLSVPVGFSAQGLPLAMQIAGAPFAEARLYRIAHAYEQAAGFWQKRPRLGAD